MKEKLRIKIILHDGLGQQYSLLKALIENYEQYAIEPNQLRPSRVIELLNASSEQTAEKSLEEIRQFLPPSVYASKSRWKGIYPLG